MCRCSPPHRIDAISESIRVTHDGADLELRALADPFPSYFATRCGRVFRESRAGALVELEQSPAQGYPAVSLRCECGSFRRVRVHTIVCSAYHGPRPDVDALVRHLDGTRTNNHADNLRWGSQVDNIRDAASHGVYVLTPDWVRLLRLDYLLGDSTGAIAARYDHNQGTVYGAVSGVTWAHVADPGPCRGARRDVELEPLLHQLYRVQRDQLRRELLSDVGGRSDA